MTAQRSVYKLGTRGSLLARTQSQLVADALQPFLAGRKIALEIITTTGDRQQETALTDAGGKGLFIQEIEEALLAGRIDFAVHSAKDMPGEMPEGLTLAATPKRLPPNDVWIGHAGKTIAELAPGATVGTTSLRRQAQLLALRPDLRTTVFRGNIDTRLRKVQEGAVAGTFLAAAGLERTGLVPAHAVLLATQDFVPAAGQGILAIQCRAFDAEVGAVLAHLNDAQTRLAWAFERRVVAALSGHCLAPIGVCAEPRDPSAHPLPPGASARRKKAHAGVGWIVRAIVATPDGRKMARATLLTEAKSPQALFRLLLETLESRGSKEILADLMSI